MSSEEIDHIANLQQRLYARDPESAPKRTFGILHPLKNKVDSSWGQRELEKKERVHTKAVSGYKKLFIFSLIFFLIALGIALFSLYRGALTLSSKNVEVTLLGNSFVSGGESLPVQVDIVNKNAADLVDASLTLAYPKGSIDGELERIKKPLGTISSGKTKTESFSVVLYGEQGVSRTVNATLEYKLAGSNATFVKESSFSVMINSSPVSLTVDAPTTTSTNQPFSMTIRTVFTGDTLLDNAVVRVEYPNGYVFGSALPAPTNGDSMWDLGDLVKGTERTITIKGKLAGDEQDEKSFHVYVGARTSETDPRISVAYNSVLHSVIIEKPSISGTISIANQESDVVALSNGSDVSGQVRWINNAAIPVTSPVFVLTLIGDTIDTNSIVADGAYYDPLEKTLTWNSETTPDFVSLQSGAQGSLPFYFKTTPIKPGSVGEIGLSLSVGGTFPDRDFLQTTISNIDQKLVRFASRLQFASQAVYSIGALKNTGPFPPRADKETTYTIEWVLRPVENPLSKLRVSAVLPFGTTWMGVIAPQSESLTYNEETRMVSWSVDALPRATGIPVNKTVSFQVKVRPTKAQVGSELPLLGEATLEAVDTVANTPLSVSRTALTTKLNTDPVYSADKEKVLP